MSFEAQDKPALPDIPSRLDSRDKCGLGFCGWHSECCFRAADVFETIVGAHGYGVLPRWHGRQADVVMLDERVANGFVRREENPLATVQAVLRTLDRRGSVARGKGGGMTAGHLAGSRPNLEALDHRRRVIHFKTLAFALGLARNGGRIRRGIGGHYLQVVRTFMHRGRTTVIKFRTYLV